jgi:uncharacterized protein YfdQ (DUF2303 family)
MQPESIASIIALAKENTRVELIEGVPHLIHPTGTQATQLHHLLAQPNRMRRHITLADLGEMVAYLKELIATDGAHYPVIYAHYEQKTFTLYPDYHKADTLEWLDHKADTRLTYSREFETWRAKNGQRMNQTDFAEFIDSNVVDIIEPTGATMVTMAQTLEATRTEVFKSAVRVSSGEHQFTWANTGDAHQNTVIPERFKIAVRIYQGDEDAIELTAKLYYRIKDGAVTFFYQLHRVDEIIEKLWTEKLVTLRENLKDAAQVFAGNGSFAAIP